RIARQNLLDFVEGSRGLADGKRLLGDSEVSQNGMPRMSRQHADDADFVGLEYRGRGAFLAHCLEDRWYPLTFGLRDLQARKDPRERLVAPLRWLFAFPQRRKRDAERQRPRRRDLDPIRKNGQTRG